MRWFARVLEWVSQCGRGSLLTWLTHLAWLTNIKRAHHINLLSRDSDVDSTRRVPRLSVFIDLQTVVWTKYRCLGKSRPKEHHAVHCTSMYNIKEWNTQLNFMFSVWAMIFHLMLGKNIFYMPGKNHRNFVPSNRNIHPLAAWVITDRLNYVGSFCEAACGIRQQQGAQWMCLHV